MRVEPGQIKHIAAHYSPQTIAEAYEILFEQRLVTMDSQELDEILWRHLSSLPYFRGFYAIEDRFFQEIQ